MTGVTWTGSFPRSNYEVRFEAARLEGSDFFASMTFPVGGFVLHLGDRAAGAATLSGCPAWTAGMPPTTKRGRTSTSKAGRWYALRLQVTDDRITGLDRRQGRGRTSIDRRAQPWVCVTARSNYPRPSVLLPTRPPAALRKIEYRLLRLAGPEGRRRRPRYLPVQRPAGAVLALEVVVGLGHVGHAAGGRVVLELLAGLVRHQTRAASARSSCRSSRSRSGSCCWCRARRCCSCPCRRRSTPAGRRRRRSRRGRSSRPRGSRRRRCSAGPRRPGPCRPASGPRGSRSAPGVRARHGREAGGQAGPVAPRRARCRVRRGRAPRSACVGCPVPPISGRSCSFARRL